MTWWCRRLHGAPRLERQPDGALAWRCPVCFRVEPWQAPEVNTALVEDLARQAVGVKVRQVAQFQVEQFRRRAQARPGRRWGVR